MKITKTIEINATKKRGKLIVHDATTLGLVLGTTSVNGNMHMFKGLKKIEGRNSWIVPIVLIQERIDFVQRRIDKDVGRVSLMKQFV